MSQSNIQTQSQTHSQPSPASNPGPSASPARPPEVVALLQQGLAAHMSGRLDEAQGCYEALLAQFPAQFDALHLLGYIAHQRGQHERAVELIRQALDIDPNQPSAHLNLGNAIAALQHRELALACFDRAIELRPDYADAHMNRANLLAQGGYDEAALTAYDTALRYQPDHVDVLINRGNVLRKQKRLDEALASYDRALALKPDSAHGHYNRANVLQDLERHEEAVRHYDRALAADPDFAEAANNRGVSLMNLERPDAALVSIERALALKPVYPFAVYNRGNALRDLGRYAEALESYAQAQQLAPGYARAYWNEALCRLMIGDFAEGWRKHEWRWQTDTFTSPYRNFAQPLWLGQPLAGATLLLHAEQGFGDTVQFCRYTEAVAARGARVVLEVQPALVTLLGTLPGVAHIVAHGDPLPPFDWQCPLLSLPLALGTTLDTIPPPPMLPVDAERAAFWHTIPNTTPTENLDAATSPRPRIGLAWSGNVSHVNDKRRSLPLARMASVLDPRLQFISLQKEVRDSDMPALMAHPQIVDPREWLGDFADTTALLSTLDLVITVDTVIAHLAGALGKPVWLLLPYKADWRWLLGRDDSPWYPTLRLFRQPYPDGWDNVLAEVRRALAERF